MATKTAQEPSTLEEFISAFNTESVRVSSFMLKDVASSDGTRQIIIAGNSIVTKYLPELLEDAETITLTNEEFYKYKYNPKRLSYDVYGTTELWSMILDLNELYSATQFNLSSLLFYFYRTKLWTSASSAHRHRDSSEHVRDYCYACPGESDDYYHLVMP